MRIAMFTNTYLPHVGGVARSVDSFSRELRKQGHDCLVIAPEFEEAHVDHPDTYRVPAVTNFNGSGFSFRLPFVGNVGESLDAFEPDIIHSHHPFLLGDTAMRQAYLRDLPIVFTHHTLYEEYTNYLPFDGDFTKKAAIELATGFANACSMVFAPSSSVATLIKERGVTVPVAVQPTGIETRAFARGDGKAFRQRFGIPLRAPLIGHVGRLAHEKNLPYLLEAMIQTLKTLPKAHAAIVGGGALEEELKNRVAEEGLDKRIHLTGTLSGKKLYNAYQSFDLFAFASKSETQGLVIAEAMAGGAPVVALDASGVRDVLKNGRNGSLLRSDSTTEEFSTAMTELLANRAKLRRRKKNALVTAESFSNRQQCKAILELYQKAIDSHQPRIEGTGIENFDSILTALEGEFQLLKVKANTLGAAITA